MHPETKASLTRWFALTKAGNWSSMDELKAAFASAVVLNGERARFEIAGGNYRLIAAYYFPGKIAFVKFIGTHTEYDRVDALTVSQF
jgi:mRNA interferase HigB